MRRLDEAEVAYQAWQGSPKRHGIELRNPYPILHTSSHRSLNERYTTVRNNSIILCSRTEDNSFHEAREQVLISPSAFIYLFIRKR